jgi:hypothetical protein
MPLWGQRLQNMRRKNRPALSGFSLDLLRPLPDVRQTVFLVCRGTLRKVLVSGIVSDIPRTVRFIYGHESDYRLKTYLNDRTWAVSIHSLADVAVSLRVRHD